MKNNAPQTGILPPLIAIMRPQHWIKNTLVLLPAFFSGRMADTDAAQLAMAFVLFCIAASAVYVFNDLCDRMADGAHPRTRRRPLATQKLSPRAAAIFLAVLLAGGAALMYGMQAPAAFNAIVLCYLGVNAGYSLGLKRVPVLELFLLASGYIFRLFAGGSVIDEPLTGWIVAVTGLLALMLAAGKRRGDIAAVEKDKAMTMAATYDPAYLGVIITVLAAALAATYVLFCISDYAQTRFGPHVTWSALFVLFGIMRYLQLAPAGGGDPVALLYRDRPMLACAALFALCFAGLIYG